MDTSIKTANTHEQINDLLRNRWSPRAFDPTCTISADDLRAILEAARWSPSASNIQPWRFIVAERGSQAFNTIMGSFSRGNASWAGNASALVLAVAVTESEDGNMYRWAQYDLGQAVAHMTLQAHMLGYHAHQLGGFTAETLKRDFNLQDRFEPLTVIALGSLGNPEDLPERYRTAETAPRQRLPLNELLLVDNAGIASDN